MARSDRTFPIVQMAWFILLAVLLASCRVVETPAQTAYPAPAAARRATASPARQPTRPTATVSSAQPTRPPATRPPATRPPATRPPATAVPTTGVPPSPTPAPTRGDVAFSLTILYTGEVHGEVRPCG
ncbi:MAG: hypothetical protein ACP5OO_07785 [Chloroflexia bacterium]